MSAVMRWGLSLYVTLAALAVLVFAASGQTLQEYRVTEAERAIAGLQVTIKEMQAEQWKLMGLLVGNLVTGVVLLAVHILTHRKGK